MIVKPQALDKINEDTNFFLFYGKNEGLKSECINKILKISKKQNVFKYDEKQIQEEKGNFFENVLSNSLFENEKTIIINHSSDKIHDVIRELIDRNIKNIKILINSGVLEKKSKLRSLFEKNKNLICIPTYTDTDETLIRIAKQFFQKHNISISQININLIVSKCNGDRLNLKNEIEKIKIFSKKKKKISTEEILKLINLTENHSFFELIDNCLANNINKTINILSENNFSNEDCIIILRTFLMKAKKILKLSIEYEKNNNINKTIDSAKPPIFWKDKEIVKKQLLKWKPKKVRNLIFLISDVELQIKKNYNSAIYIITNFILEQTGSKFNN